MVKRIMIFLCFFILTLYLPAEEIADVHPAGENEAGFTLLKSLVASFSELANTGKGGADEVLTMLQYHMAELKKAKAQRQVDAVFYVRFHRILEVVMLTIRMPGEDPEGILDNYTFQEMKNFIYDITGEDATLPPPEHRGIGAIAGAIAEEVINLHIYLEGKENRDKILKQYIEFTKTPDRDLM